jgi:hypothetical protein
MALYSPLSRAGKAIGGIELIRGRGLGRGGLSGAILGVPRNEAGTIKWHYTAPSPAPGKRLGH